MLKLPKIPTAAKNVQIFKRRKEYTKLDKLLVYNMLFDSQVLEPEIKRVMSEIVENQNIKNEAFELLFR